MTILRTPDVIRLVGLSRTTIWRQERKGQFPSRVRLGPQSVGWYEDEIHNWIASRPRGMANSPHALNTEVLDKQKLSLADFCEVG